MATRRAHGIIRDIAVHLVQEKKMAVLGSLNNRKPVDASQMAGRDLLSVLSEWERRNILVLVSSCGAIARSESQYGCRFATPAENDRRRIHGT